MTEAPLKATFKAGTGFDAPWITIDGNDPVELNNRVVGVKNHPELLQNVVELSRTFQAVNTAGPLLNNQPVQNQQQVGTVTQGPWGQNQGQQQQQQQQQPVQQQGQAQTHPEGKTCEVCNSLLEFKLTGTGKTTWRCPQWRWNNGNPNNHTQIWGN